MKKIKGQTFLMQQYEKRYFTHNKNKYIKKRTFWALHFLGNIYVFGNPPVHLLCSYVYFLLLSNKNEILDKS